MIYRVFRSEDPPFPHPWHSWPVLWWPCSANRNREGYLSYSDYYHGGMIASQCSRSSRLLAAGAGPLSILWAELVSGVPIFLLEPAALARMRSVPSSEIDSARKDWLGCSPMISWWLSPQSYP